MREVSSFEDLECYQAARAVRIRIAALCAGMPPDERFRLCDQLIRASRSVTANIAEGFGRHHHKENLQFCRQARGSLTETIEHLHIARDERYLACETHDKCVAEVTSALRLLNGYIRYLKTCIGDAPASR